jgi:hypothetical protein
MSDMRSTERLLELIEEQATAIRTASHGGVLDPDANAVLIEDATAELRRRGDLLVRARDLELLVQAVGREQVLLGEDEAQALARLDGALDVDGA